MKRLLKDVEGVWLDSMTKESWFKHRKLVKESKCESCKRLHNDVEGEIALAFVTNEINKHICSDCGKHYISLGARDLLKEKTEHKNRKDTLVVQIKEAGFHESRYTKKLSERGIEELEELLVKQLKIKAEADRIDAIVISEEDKFMEDYLKTDYQVIQSDYLKCTTQIESYFKDDYHDYFDCGQGYYEEAATVIVKIAKKFYEVTLLAEICSSKQDHGDRLYWVEDIEKVTWKEIDKPLKKTKTKVIYEFDINSDEDNKITSWLNENGFNDKFKKI